MRNRWQLPLLTLAGLAAAITFAALVHLPPVGAHAGPGADRWSIEDPHLPDTQITWTNNQHPHPQKDGWRIEFGHEDDWDGSPGQSPCENPSLHGLREGSVRAHCAYVVKHYNPWQVRKEAHTHWGTPEHPRHGDVISSWCAVVARGVAGGRTVFEPADTILFVDATGQATCIDGDDHHSGGPGAQAGTQPTHRYHGDDDFIDQHGTTINAGIAQEVAQVAANSHTLRGRLGGAPGTPRHRPDEVVAQGRHRNDGSINYGSQNSLNLIGRHDHKTVMFWVWWEHAADEEPEPPEEVEEPQDTSFAPEVSVRVVGGADDSSHGGTRFRVSIKIERLVHRSRHHQDCPPKHSAGSSFASSLYWLSGVLRHGCVAL